VRAKALLDEKGVAYEEYDVTMGGPKRAEMVERAPGAATVPQIFVNDQALGGATISRRSTAPASSTLLDSPDLGHECARARGAVADDQRHRSAGQCRHCRCGRPRGAGRGSDAVHPEMAGLIDRDRARAALHIVAEAANPVLAVAQEAAARHGIWVHLGSLAIRPDQPAEGGDARWANRAFVIDGAGQIAAAMTRCTCSTWILPRAKPGADRLPIALGRPWSRSKPRSVAWAWRSAMTSAFRPCSRHWAKPCDCIAIPAAFTVPTGAAHWHLMQRARAVEASAFVISAAQTGRHEDGRETYGHSLVVDPWGDILLDMGGNAGAGLAEIDLGRLAAVRQQLPSLANKRPVPISRTMIVFDLQCTGGQHRFEGWFASSADYARQQERGWSPARSCGSGEVIKAVMAGRGAQGQPGAGLARAKPGGRCTRRARRCGAGQVVPASKAAARGRGDAARRGPGPGRGDQVIGLGRRSFADDARAMHYGDKDAAPIHGQATAHRSAGIAGRGH
jgi:predicted amidohydrolase/glutaredoxin